MSDGQGSRQGRAGQEGQAQEGEQQEVTWAFRPTAIFDELSFGREHLFMSDSPGEIAGDDVCIVCDDRRDNHEGRMHVFTPTGTRVDTAQFGPARVERGRTGDDTPRRHQTHWGPSQSQPVMGDPVLRQALVDKGILTPEDLDAAMRKISAITGQVMRGG